MSSALPPLYVECPKSDRQWRGSPRSWSDHPNLYSLRCPSCGSGLKFAVDGAHLAALPGWVGEVRNDHTLTLAGDRAGV